MKIMGGFLLVGSGLLACSLSVFGADCDERSTPLECYEDAIQRLNQARAEISVFDEGIKRAKERADRAIRQVESQRQDLEKKITTAQGHLAK